MEMLSYGGGERSLAKRILGRFRDPQPAFGVPIHGNRFFDQGSDATRLMSKSGGNDDFFNRFVGRGGAALRIMQAGQFLLAHQQVASRFPAQAMPRNNTAR